MTKADINCCCRWYKFMKSNNNKKLVKLDDRVKQVIENLNSNKIFNTGGRAGGGHPDHQGGDGGGQREVLVHGEQQCRWREC